MSTESGPLRLVPIREYRPKPTKECSACRTQRLQCDGKKLECSHCLLAGRECDRCVLSSKSLSPPTVTPVLHQFVPIATALTPTLFTSDRELRSFTFFRECTIPRISRFFDFDFWGRLVLQAMHHEPAIRHAAIALGALHEGFTLHDNYLSGKAGEDDFAVQQYVKSLGSLLEPTKGNGKQAVDVALVTCVLFICFETLRGHQGAALAHVIGGVKIISELSSKPTSTTSSLTVSSIPYIPLSALKLIFIRLNTQAGTISFNRGPQIPSKAFDDGPVGFHESIPSAFTSTTEAYNSLNYISIVGARSIPRQLLISPPSPLDSAKMQVQMELARSVANFRLLEWNRAFESFIEKSIPCDESTLQALRILRIHRMLMGMIFRMDFSRALVDETIWDDFSDEFKAIMLLGAEIVDTEKKSKDVRKAKFNLDTGVIFPLYFVAVKCRDFGLRWKAIALMRESERQEGVWNSVLTAKVAERLVTVEEESLKGRRPEADGVPREKRVVGVELRFDMEERRAFWKYRKGTPKGEIGDTYTPELSVEEWIEW